MNTLSPNTFLQGGRYKILKVLGQGGFGITYLAMQSGLERKVAIKEFFMKELCDRDESTSHVTLGTSGICETVNRFREKFLKEARNIARLNHPNIVRIIDVFEENGTAYYVMEYAGKSSLAETIKQKGCLAEPVAKRYILQVAEALRYIHQQKMNHLDVKPANIMINEKDEAVLDGVLGAYDTTIARFDAAVVAEEVEEAERLQKEMDRQARSELRAAKREERKSKREERQKILEEEFALLRKHI